MTSDVKKYVVFAFVISQQINKIIANGHEKLNKLMTVQTP